MGKARSMDLRLRTPVAVDDGMSFQTAAISV